MGDVAIAAGLQIGVESSVNLFGESITITRAGESVRNPANPSLRLPATDISVSTEAIISDVEDRIIDGNIILLGDKQCVIKADLENEGKRFFPKIGDKITDSNDNMLIIVRVNTNRVAGVDVSYEALLR